MQKLKFETWRKDTLKLTIMASVLSVSGTAGGVLLLVAKSPLLFNISLCSNLSTRVRVLPGTTATAKGEISKGQNTFSFIP